MSNNPSWLIEGEWPSPLFDCFAAGPSVCIISLCCPCIQYGFNVHNLSVKLQSRPSENVKLSEISCFKAGLTYTCYSFCGMCCIAHSLFRQNYRKYNNIPAGNDYLVTTCCIPCALVQEARYIQYLYGINTTYTCCTSCYPSKKYTKTKETKVVPVAIEGANGKDDEDDVKKQKLEDEEDSKDDITPPPVGDRSAIHGGISTKGLGGSQKGLGGGPGGPPGMNRAMSMKRSNSQWIKEDK